MLSKSRGLNYFTKRVIIVKKQKLCKVWAWGMGGERWRKSSKESKNRKLGGKKPWNSRRQWKKNISRRTEWWTVLNATNDVKKYENWELTEVTEVTRDTGKNNFRGADTKQKHDWNQIRKEWQEGIVGSK